MADPRLNLPNNDTDDNGWILWYNDLTPYLSKNDANTIWLAYWKQRKSFSANTTALRKFMEGKGIDIDSDVPIYGKAKDIISGAIDSVSSIMGIAKWAILGTGILIIASLGLLIINIARKPVETISAAGSAAASFKGMGGK